MSTRLSFRNKLLFLVMPIVAIGLLSQGFSAYSTLNHVIEEDLTASMLATTAKSAETINIWFKTLLLEPETIASTPAAKAINSDFSQVDRYNINRYQQLHKRHPELFQDIYAANRHGEYHTVQQSGGKYSVFVGDIANRDYFIALMAGGAPRITPPLLSRTTGQPTIFMVAPIHDEESRPQGLIGAGISLSYVQKIASGLKNGETGYGVIVARDGTFVSHPNPDFVMKKKITELEDRSVVELGKKMVAGNSGVFRYEFGGQKKIAFYQPILISGWSVAAVLPEEELFAPATRMLRALAFASLIILALVCISLVFAAQHLTRPILIIRDAMNRFTQKDFSSRSDLIRDDELGDLSRNFNHMAETIQHHSDDLEHTIAERTDELVKKNEIILREKELAEKAIHEITRLLAEQQELIAKLEDAKGQLLQSEKMASVGQLAAGVAHEINNPIGFINSNLNTLSKSVDDLLSVISAYEAADPLIDTEPATAAAIRAAKTSADLDYLREDTQNLIKESIDGAQRVRKIVENLRDFSRTDSGEWHTARLEDCLESTLNIVWNEIKYKAVVHKEYAGVPEIECIATQLNQVFLNLMVNAAHAIEAQGTITLRTGYDERNAWVEVEDTGNGIASEHINRIFDPFFTTKPVGQGTGLGLSISFGIVQRHHGTITVCSEPGKGSIFRVTLPRLRAPEAPA